MPLCWHTSCTLLTSMQHDGLSLKCILWNRDGGIESPWAVSTAEILLRTRMDSQYPVNQANISLSQMIKDKGSRNLDSLIYFEFIWGSHPSGHNDIIESSITSSYSDMFFSNIIIWSLHIAIKKKKIYTLKLIETNHTWGRSPKTGGR